MPINSDAFLSRRSPRCTRLIHPERCLSAMLILKNSIPYPTQKGDILNELMRGHSHCGKTYSKGRQIGSPRPLEAFVPPRRIRHSWIGIRSDLMKGTAHDQCIRVPEEYVVATIIHCQSRPLPGASFARS